MSSVDKKLVRAWARQQAGSARRAVMPVVIVGCAATLIGIGQAWCLASVIDDLLVRDDEKVSALICVFAVMSVIRALCFLAQENYAARAGVESRGRLRRSVLDSVIRIGPALLRRQHSAEIAALLVDRIEVLDGYFARWLPASITWLFFPALVLFAVFMVNPQAAVILALCGVLIPLAQALFGIGAALASRNQFLSMVRLQARFLDRIRGIATIVLANAVEHEAELLACSAGELRRRTVKILSVAFLSSAAIDLALVLSIIVIVLMQGHFINSESDSAAHIHTVPVYYKTLFALFLTPEFFAPFRGLALAYQDRAQAAGAAEAMDGLGHSAVTVTDTGSAAADTVPCGVIVEAQSLTYCWSENGPVILDRLDFSVGPGETLLLDGVSGAGKSTLIELLLGFVRPSSGRILFNGQDIVTMRGREIARYLAWIGQKPVIFAGTLRENLMFARPEADDAALDRVIAAASIDRFLKDLPSGLDTVIGEGGFGLSGGQVQRVAIARAYLKDAPLLLLDEPTAHLDPRTEREIVAALSGLVAGRTVVLSSHSVIMQELATARLSLGIHDRLEGYL